jgi:glycosyltransferase involved in cell wall biosynthesis
VINNIVRLRGEARPVELSVIIPVIGRHDDPVGVFRAYRNALETTGLNVEFIYVLDAAFPHLVAGLRTLQAGGEPVTVVELTQRFGEAVCLNVGVERARGEWLLLLPPYLQIEPTALPALVAALDRVDLAAAVRDRRGDHLASRVRAWGLTQLARIAGSGVRDLGCNVVACRRAVLSELVLQDEHHRFLPLLARNAGFAIEHQVAPQATADRRFRLHAPSMYVGRLVDVAAIAFLLRFMQRPFRFFGSVGAVMAMTGLVLGSILSFERLVLHTPLAERPALLLAVVLVILGVQIAAVGLIAEIIIFTRARRLPTYRIAQIVEGGSPSATRPGPVPAATVPAGAPHSPAPASNASPAG